MTRKKKPAPRPKRVEITDSDGWTHITKGLKNTHLTTSPVSCNGTKIQPAPIPSGQTLTELRKTHTHYRSQWLASPSYQQIRDLLVREILPSLDDSGADEERKIDRCIVLGLGSLSNGGRSSWWELVFLETVLSLLQPAASDGEGAPPLETMIQDPVFNAMDHTFFSSLGYTVLADPLAFDEITESTFLFAPHLEVSNYAEALSKARPMMCVGSDVREYIDKADWHSRERRKESEEEEEEIVEVFQRYMDAMRSWPLPEFKKDHWMCFTCIYSKKPNDAD
ncbi:MAG: hypothetical protein LQ350_001587 [Teloschistes chrysophthalmus]|nr:MAG: hypothetical protein LQ350_001587 [Niorma chrysophthalma]